MNNLHQNGSFFGERSTSFLNETVFKIIHQKKYPLDFNSFNSLHSAAHFLPHKIYTNPYSLIHKSFAYRLRHALTSELWSEDERKIAVTNVQSENKQLIPLYSSSQCFDEVSEKISGFCDRKRIKEPFRSQKLISKWLRTVPSKIKRKDKSKIMGTQYSHSKLIKNLEKNLSHQLLDQQGFSQLEPSTDLNIKPQKQQPRSIKFQQGSTSQQMPNQRRKNLQDLNKQLQVDMKTYLKESQYLGVDKYDKMRIMGEPKKDNEPATLNFTIDSSNIIYKGLQIYDFIQKITKQDIRGPQSSLPP